MFYFKPTFCLHSISFGESSSLIANGDYSSVMLAFMPILALDSDLDKL
jgi:hypothetical protein